MQDNEIYKFMKANGLTDKDQATFLNEYSNPQKAKEVFDFFKANKLTDKDETSFYDTYLKKKDTPSPLSATPSRLPKISEQVSPLQQGVNIVGGGVIGDISKSVQKESPKKENAYFKQRFLGVRPSAKGDIVERIYDDPMGVGVLQVAPTEREVKPKEQPLDKVESKDKSLRGVKPIAPSKYEYDPQGWILNMVSALDKGIYKTLGTTVQAVGTGLQGVTSKITGGTGEGAISDALIKLGSSYNQMIDELTPQDESFKNSLSDQLGQALGYVAGLYLTGATSAAARTAGMGVAGRNAAVVASQTPKSLTTAIKDVVKSTASPTGIVGGLGIGQAEFDRAKQAGATDEQAFEAFWKNAATGSVLEQLPVMHFLKRFNNATYGGVVNYIKTKGVAGLTGGLEEMTTEMLQQLYANKTAKDIYNENQDLFEGVAGNGTIGFSVGFLLNAMGANAKILRKQGKVNEAKLVENQVKELEEKAKGQAPTNSSIATKIAVNGNEEGLQRAQAELDNDLQKGLISEEEYQDKVAVAQKVAEINSKIPDYVQGLNRATSIELIDERDRLIEELNQREEQKKGIDVAYHKALDEASKEVKGRIDEINKKIAKIAEEKGVSVVTPEENIPVETTTISAKEYTPQTKKSGVSVVLPKQGEVNVESVEPPTLLKQAVAEEEIKKTIEEQLPNQEIVEQPEVIEGVKVEQEPIFGLNKDNKQPFTTKSKKQIVSFENGDLIVKDAKTGADVSPKTKRKALREYAENFDFTVGERAAEPTPDMQFRDENELNQYVVENSQNPTELAEIYINQEPTTQPLSTVERMIADYGVGKVTNKSFERFGDRNLKGLSMAKAYFNNETGQSIDQVAKEMSDHYDVEITPQDIADFMVRFPNGEGTALKLVESEVASNAAAKFKELTGLNLNQEIAQKVIEQQFNKLSKAEQLIAQQDYESATQLEEAYWREYEQTNGFTKESPRAETKPNEQGERQREPKADISKEPIGETKPKKEDVEPKSPLEQQYEEASQKKGEKAQQKAKEKLISDNFDGIVAQLMTKNKIKRKC